MQEINNIILEIVDKKSDVASEGRVILEGSEKKDESASVKDIKKIFYGLCKTDNWMLEITEKNIKGTNTKNGLVTIYKWDLTSELENDVNTVKLGYNQSIKSYSVIKKSEILAELNESLRKSKSNIDPIKTLTSIKVVEKFEVDQFNYFILFMKGEMHSNWQFIRYKNTLYELVHDLGEFEPVTSLQSLQCSNVNN